MRYLRKLTLLLILSALTASLACGRGFAQTALPKFVNGRIVTLSYQEGEPDRTLSITHIVKGKVEKPVLLCRMPNVWSNGGGILSPSLKYYLAYLSGDGYCPGIRIVHIGVNSTRDVSLFDFAIAPVAWSPDGDSILLTSEATDKVTYWKAASRGMEPPAQLPIYTILHSPTGTFVRLVSTPAEVILLPFWSKDGKAIVYIAQVPGGSSRQKRVVFVKVPLLLTSGKVKAGAERRLKDSEVRLEISPFICDIIPAWEKRGADAHHLLRFVDFYLRQSQTLAIAPLSRKIFMMAPYGNFDILNADKRGTVFHSTAALSPVTHPDAVWSADEKHVLFLGTDPAARDITCNLIWLNPATGKAVIIDMSQYLAGEPLQVMP